MEDGRKTKMLLHIFRVYHIKTEKNFILEHTRAQKIVDKKI